MTKQEEFNQKIKIWADECVVALKASIVAHGAVSGRKYKGDTDINLKESLYHRVTMKNGMAFKVGFGFKKHGIFVHYGIAGRGGTVHVAEKKWWSDVMNKQYDLLAEIVADYGAEVVADKLTLQFNTTNFK